MARGAISTAASRGTQVDGEVLDASVIANLDRLLGDFEAWRKTIETDQQAEQKRLAREVERAESDAAAAEKRVGQLEAN